MLLNKFINNIFNNEKSNYDTISFVWKSQILNSVFDGTIYKLLYEKVCNFLLSSYHFQNEIFEGKSINDTTIDTLTRIVINLNKTKKFYYLHENLVKMAPLSNITILLNSFLDKHLVKYSTFINDLLSFFLIIHLKKDFQNFKILNYRDYLITNPIERILLKKFNIIKSVYNYDLLKKYINDDNHILSQFILDFLNLALRALKKYKIKEYDKFLNNYLIIFEILYFVIKICYFEIKNYIKLIELLELFFNEFYKGFKILLEFNDKNIFNQIKKLINYISKIVFIIMVNFNDKIIEKYLNLNKEDNNSNNNNNEIEFEENFKNSQFIHYISNHSKSLFKILISSSIIYNTYILNQNFGSKNLLKNNKIIDMIIFVNHSLELFTLTDNVYFKSLDEIKIIDFLYYEIFLNKILNREKTEENYEIQFIKKNNFNGEIENDDYFEIVSKTNERNLFKTMFIETYNLKSKLENVIKLFFYSKINFESLDIKFQNILIEFGKNWEKEDSKFENINIENIKLKNFYKNKIFFNEKENSLLRLNLIQKYKIKISKITKIFFKNLTYDKIITYENSSNNPINNFNEPDQIHSRIIIYELIYSQIDNTLTKFFIIDPIMKRYDEKTVKIIFDFLLFYTLCKEGLIYFLLGKNLSRIIEIFKIFPNLTLNFLNLIAEGIYLYDINISHHKQLPILLNVIYKYIKDNLNNNDNEEPQDYIKECIITTMSFLNYLSLNFTIDNLSKICEKILEEIEKLISKKKILKIFAYNKIMKKFIQYEDKEFNIADEEEKEKILELYPENFIVDDKTYELAYIKKIWDKYKTSNLFPVLDKNFKRTLFKFKNSNYEEEEEKIPNNKNNFLKNKQKSVLSSSSLNSNSFQKFSSFKSINLKKNNYRRSIFYINTSNKKGPFFFLKGNKSPNNRKNSYNSLHSSSNNLIPINKLKNKNEEDNYVINEERYYSSEESSSNKLKKKKKLENFYFDILNDLYESNFNYENKYINLEQKIFFSLLNVMSNITFYFKINSSKFKIFNSINDIYFFKLLLSENYLNLEYRTILLVYIRMTYLNELIDENNFLISDKYMNSEEYSENLLLLRNLLDDQNATYLNIPEFYLEKITDPTKIEFLNKFKKKNAFIKFENIKNLKLVIEIFIHEIKNMYYYIFIEKNINIINNYIIQILYCIKITSDVFITYEISSHLILWLYNLALEFLPKVDFFISFFNTIKYQLNLNYINIEKKEDHTYLEMKKDDFDIYNVENIYGIILEAIQKIYEKTDFDKNYKLSTFIINYKKKDKLNFVNFTLNKTEIPFYIFDENLDKENNIQEEIINNNLFTDDFILDNINYIKFIEIKQKYLNEFNNFFETSFYDIINNSSYEMTLNIKEIFLNYCVVYIFNLKYLPEDSLISFLTMLNKLLIYEPEKTQKSLNLIFESKNKENNSKIISEIENDIFFRYEETFFNNLVSILRENININIIMSKNIVISKRYEKINYSTKILIQFFQLLGEGHNKDFQNLIITGQFNNTFELQKDEIDNINVFNIMCNTLGIILNCFIRYKNLLLKGELPFDKLVILLYNILQFIIEYFQGTNIEKFKIMYNYLKKNFDKIHNFLFEFVEEYNNSNKINLINDKNNLHIILKITLIELISSLIEEGNADNPNLNVLTEIMETFSPIKLFEDSVKNFLKYTEKNKNLSKYKLENENILPILMEMYKYDKNFQNSLDLKYSLKVFYYLKILSDIYDRVEVKNFLNNLHHIYINNIINESNMNNSNLDNSNYYKILFQRIISNISINQSNNNIIKNESFHNQNYLNENKIDDQLKSQMKFEKCNYVMNKFLSKLLTRIEIRESQNESIRDYNFFVIPNICFLLSERTIENFNNYVDRTNIHSKIINLITETDYFICEMFYHNKYYLKYSKFSKFLVEINVKSAENINYLFIVAQNIILIICYYSRDELKIYKYKNKMLVISYFLSYVHFLFIIITIIIWTYYFSELEFIHNIMRNYKQNFIFRTLEDKNSHFNTLNENLNNLFKKFYSKISLSQKLYTLIVDTILFNRQICFIITTFFCLCLYFITRNGLFISIPILFIANMNDLLFGILVSIKMRWVHLLLTVLYTYILVYIFSLFAFYYVNKSFKFSDLINITQKTENNSENMCDSILQCLLTMISYGSRSGGGIGDIIIKLSYRSDIKSFVIRFFFDVSFHIIIILFLINIILGIIVDNFAEFRNNLDELNNDKNNICFICQMSRDDARNKNLNFDLHRETVHNLWNYVYFLTYLHINNENNFKKLESEVWNKLINLDTSWIPIKNDNEKENENSNEIIDTNLLIIENILKSNDIQIYFFVNEEIFENKMKIVDFSFKISLEFIKNYLNFYPNKKNNFKNFINNFQDKESNDLFKLKMKIWIVQGCKKNIKIISNINLINEILIICDKGHIPYTKIINCNVNKNNLNNDNIHYENIEMICVGPDDNKKIKDILDRYINS